MFYCFNDDERPNFHLVKVVIFCCIFVHKGESAMENELNLPEFWFVFVIMNMIKFTIWCLIWCINSNILIYVESIKEGFIFFFLVKYCICCTLLFSSVWHVGNYTEVTIPCSCISCSEIEITTAPRKIFPLLALFKWNSLGSHCANKFFRHWGF